MTWQQTDFGKRAEKQTERLPVQGGTSSVCQRMINKVHGVASSLFTDLIRDVLSFWRKAVFVIEVVFHRAFNHVEVIFSLRISVKVHLFKNVYFL